MPLQDDSSTYEVLRSFRVRPRTLVIVLLVIMVSVANTLVDLAQLLKALLP
jgi:hypothetical protein